jgi:hypothetical protein
MGTDHELSTSNLHEPRKVLDFVSSGQLTTCGNAEGHETLVHDGYALLAFVRFAKKSIAYASDRLSPHKWLRYGLQALSCGMSESLCDV